ncbi:crooked neck-like protein 1 [Sinocyclocheilus rhinocerous]|uniref:crooked neck-like protein 1 n=1 Tax=Sinocyclocheilus rhinocerous TaxID=307959 RepID=UPI0007B88787|nr:PREDICTED: crooked neck-like protein 1 [Sinocyclocheilus rhinocerous]
MASTAAGKQRIPKVAKVKNKAPAEVQITAEQLLREAKERELELLPPPPKQKITDAEELNDYKLKKRKGFEDNIRKNRTVISNWIKYAQWEESLKEVQRARSIYERALDVDHRNITLWLKYAEMEMKNRQVNHARNIWDRAITILPRVNQFWYKYTYMEEMLGNIAGCRQVFERWMEWEPEEQAWHSYINFELRYKEVDKSRSIYENYASPHNYDAWFDYLRLVESDTDADTVREVYERAIANIPPIQEKRHWRRYIYLWINYALYEELEVKDPERTRQVYQACLELIPHKKFTFAKIWLLYGQFEIRQKNLQNARRGLGTAIGKCPKNKLFKGYIELELQLREFDRCRKLYEKYLEFSPENCTTWIKFAELEAILGDTDRARAIFELAIGQPRLDMPEVLWKSYIDFEIEQEEYDNTRGLYKRLLQRTQHVKVWISYGQFELSIDSDDRIQRCRQIYEEANKSMQSCEEKEERLMLLESWRDFEDEFGSFANKERVRKLLPEKVKKRRKITAEDGSDAGWEEYYDYIFPEDAANQPNLKLLAMAKMWKKQQQDEDEEEQEEEEEGQQVPQGKEAQESPEPEEQGPAAQREQPENEYDDRDDDEESSSSSDSESDGGDRQDDKTEQTKADTENH